MTTYRQTASENISRRQFVSSIAGTSTLAAALPNALASRQSDDNEFSFLLLGDTHFDRIEHHDMQWMREHFAKDIRQVEGYCKHTEDKLPGLLAAAKNQLARANPATAFALHVGDLVEGICGNKELALKHCREGWEFFRNAELDVPLLMTKGNHDITGPGAAEAYQEVLLQKTAAELGRDKLERTSYSFRQGENLFAVFDAYDRTAIDWLEGVVQDNEFRQLFVLMHLPVVPYNARSNWRVYYHINHAERRERLLDLLGKHRAIVLCGHLHKYCLLVRRCRTGKFAQLAVSSILKDTVANAAETLAGVASYGQQLTDLEPSFSPESLEARKAILTAEKPFIEHFEYAAKSGFGMLSVSPNGIQAAMHEGTNDAPWTTVSLSDLLR